MLFRLLIIAYSFRKEDCDKTYISEKAHILFKDVWRSPPALNYRIMVLILCFKETGCELWYIFFDDNDGGYITQSSF